MTVTTPMNICNSPSLASSSNSSTGNRFTVSDTRRVFQPAGLVKTASARERLHKQLNRSRTLLREDLDMPQQVLAMQNFHVASHAEWVQRHTPRPFTDDQKVASLKFIVTEAERYQTQRQIKALKRTVLSRAAQSLGDQCPKNYMQVTKASAVVINDINVILQLPRDQLPGSMSSLQFAASAVLALPMWLAPRAPKPDGHRPSPPRSPTDDSEIAQSGPSKPRSFKRPSIDC